MKNGESTVARPGDDNADADADKDNADEYKYDEYADGDEYDDDESDDGVEYEHKEEEGDDDDDDVPSTSGGVSQDTVCTVCVSAASPSGVVPAGGGGGTASPPARRSKHAFPAGGWTGLSGGGWLARWHPNPFAAAARDVEDIACAFHVVFFTLVTCESLLGAGVAAALTMLFVRYEYYGASLAANVSWAFVSFALVLPLTTAITTSFRRREDALRELAGLRAALQCLLTAHCEWDWCPPAGPKDGWGGRSHAALAGHASRARAAVERVLDALEGVLALPCVTRARHHLFRHGERDSVNLARARGVSRIWRAFSELSGLAERLKARGLPGNEAARIRQFEQLARRHIQGMLHVKDYRTPQQLRSLSRVLILVHPALLGPYYSWLAGYGRGDEYPHANVAFAVFAAVLTTMVLYGLYNTEHSLEDPFDGDGWEKVHVRHDLAELRVHLDAISSPRGT